MMGDFRWMAVLGVLLAAALSGAGCGGSGCKNECTPGSKSCDGNTLMTCGDYDGDGCAEWGDPDPCPDQCQVDRCVTTCEDACSDGARRCAGDGFQVCSDTDNDGCTEWGQTQSCGPSKTCTGDGQCVDACVDQCAAGQTRCADDASQYQECVCPPDDCCDWGDPIDCPAGDSCSNGQCVACSDDCTPAGARRCSGATAYEVCGDVDDDPCNEWSQPTECPQGEECVGGICSQPCEDECPGNGARTCTQDQRAFQTCGDYDADACLEWGDAKACAETEICIEGVCQFECVDECAAGEKRCLGNGYQTCGDHDADPCSEWSAVTECKHDETCSNGVCSVTCQDECQAGARECSGFQSWRECGEFDHDPCTDWGEPQGCALWERCLDVAGPAECVVICFNECDMPGQQVCSGDGYTVCEDSDWDACLEWSEVIACAEDERCSENPETGQGECNSMPCTDDCDSAGLRQCYDANGWRECGEFDNDDCLDWGPVRVCAAGEVCEAGECVATCEDACEPGEAGCIDGQTRYECADADGDGCLDQVPVACGPDETCVDGACQSDCIDDDLEPNDTADESYPLDAGNQPALVICPDDDDWYDLAVPADQGLSVTIGFNHDEGDLDLALYRLDDLEQPLAVSAGISDSETVVAPAGEAAFYLVRVFGYAGAANVYELTVDYVAAGDCLDDGLEENDSLEAAKFVLDGVYEDLVICPDDDDWYVNYMFAGEDLAVDVLFTHAADGDLDLEVVDAQGVVLDISDSTSDDEHLTVPIEIEGTYYVHVFGYDGGQNDYDMIITYGEPCQDDDYEENDTRATAQPLEPGSYDTLVLCANDPDWYAVEVNEGGDLLVGITFSHADGDLDLHLYDPAGDQIDYSVSTDDDELVGAEGLAAGTYFVRVSGWDGAENLYDLEIVE